MDTSEALIKFEGIPTDHGHAEYSDFFPIEEWTKGYDNTFSTHATPVPADERSGSLAIPCSFLCEVGTHGVGLFGILNENKLIKSAELLLFRSNHMFCRATLKDIQIRYIKWMTPDPRVKMKVSFVYARIDEEFFAIPDGEEQGLAFSKWNLKENNANVMDPGPDTAAEAAPAAAAVAVASPPKKEEEDINLRNFRFRFVIEETEEAIPNNKFTVMLEDGTIIKGRTDKEGYGTVEKITAEKLTLSFPDYSLIGLLDSEDDFEKDLKLEVTDEEPIITYSDEDEVYGSG